MAGSSLFALLDDIASVLDDVAVMSKLAAKKTAGVLGDDLALNAEQVSGVRAERELPVVWAVAKGSALNKLILVPAALLISAVLPVAVAYLLMLGGLYLCYEGVEKLWHYYAHRNEHNEHKQNLRSALIEAPEALLALEKSKIKGAIRTDFVLSAEIIVIVLGTVSGAPFDTQVMVLVLMATVMTVGVYGFVALIVKLDDIGLALQQKNNAVAKGVGSAILAFCPWLMRALSIVGTAAMFLVGGGILVHGLPFLHHLLAVLPLPWLSGLLLNLVVGLAAGAIAVVAMTLGHKLFKKN